MHLPRELRLRTITGTLACLVTLALMHAGCAQGSSDDESVQPGIPRSEAGPRPDDEGGDPDGPTNPEDSGSTTKKDSGGTADEDSGSPEDSGTPDAGPDACSTALAALGWNFDGNDGGFTHGVLDNAAAQASWPFDPWGWGTAANGLPCKGGKCWASELTQNYAQCGRGYLMSPAVDLSKCASASSLKLSFQHAYAFWAGLYGGIQYKDGGIVEFSADGGATWQLAQNPSPGYPGKTNINPQQTSSYKCVLETNFYVNNKDGYVGLRTNYEKVEIPIPANMRTAKFRVRFSQSSGVSSQTSNANTSRSGTAAGWRIDDIAFAR